MSNPMLASLGALPSEITLQILSHLEVEDVAQASRTCRRLREACCDDQLWRRCVEAQLGYSVPTTPSSLTYKDLYIAHHSHWFLPRYKIWFSDSFPHGQLILVRYDPRRGCIEGYTMAAFSPRQLARIIEWDGKPVRFAPFEPMVQLDLNMPKLHLSLLDLKAAASTGNSAQCEILMEGPSPPGSRIASSFLLTKLYPYHLLDENSAVWPPQIVPVPGDQRTRNSSESLFRSKGHKPTKRSEISRSTFRILQWLEYSAFMPIHFMGTSGRAAEKALTYSTVDPTAYTPTPEKPWQGIWIGDYAGHGTEFVLITQPDRPKPLPEKALKAFRKWPYNSFDSFVDMHDDDDVNNATNNYADERQEEEDEDTFEDAQSSWTSPDESAPPDEAPFKGRLEAIKLTGDPNVPRGEYTFIVQDLGSAGFVRYQKSPIFDDMPKSDDPDFKGARVVKCIGHVAQTGFLGDNYLPSHLIIVDENRLAQYWHPWGHMSFYKRVDIDKLLSF